MDAAREWAASIAWSAPLAMQTVKEVQREIECVPLRTGVSQNAHAIPCRPTARCLNLTMLKKALRLLSKNVNPISKVNDVS